MGIQATNRVIDVKRQISDQVRRYERRIEIGKQKRGNSRFKIALKGTMECTQCHRKMRKDIAREQITNKRENAPICIPCILGIARKDKPVSIYKGWKKETKKKFNKILKGYDK